MQALAIVLALMGVATRIDAAATGHAYVVSSVVLFGIALIVCAMHIFRDRFCTGGK